MNVETFTLAMPGLSSKLAEQYLSPMEMAMNEYAITTEMRSRMWLAQVGHESVSLRYFEEIASGVAYEGRTDLGNTQKGDGVRYKGRGPIQITGRTNYSAAAKALNLPLVEHPEMAAEPRYAFRVSAWWWQAHGLNEISDTGDVVTATRRINGGLNGLADREARYNLCKTLGTKVIPTKVTEPITPHYFEGDMLFIRNDSQSNVPGPGGKGGLAPGDIAACSPAGAVKMGNDWTAIETAYKNAGVPLVLIQSASLLARFTKIAIFA